LRRWPRLGAARQGAQPRARLPGREAGQRQGEVSPGKKNDATRRSRESPWWGREDGEGERGREGEFTSATRRSSETQRAGRGSDGGDGEAESDELGEGRGRFWRHRGQKKNCTMSRTGR
jgi:hypothetical protein